MRKQIRKLRHWKQRFDKNAAFVFRRRLAYGIETYEPGDPIPKILAENPAKLRRFWESRTIELAEFEDPDVATGQPQATMMPAPLPTDLEGVAVAKGNGSWFIVTTPLGDEVKVNGQKALTALLDELRVEAAKEESPEDDNPEEGLLGSSVLNSTYEIEGETVALGDIVFMAFEDTGLSTREWNEMAGEEREQLLRQSLYWMTYQGEDDADDADDDAETEATEDADADGADQDETGNADERARETDGTFKGDDPATSDVNEAYADGKGPQEEGDDWLDGDDPEA